MCLGLVTTSGLNTCLMSRNGLITLHVAVMFIIGLWIHTELLYALCNTITSNVSISIAQRAYERPCQVRVNAWQVRVNRSLLLCTSDVFRALIRDTLCLPIVPKSSRPRSVSDYELRGKEKQHIFVGQKDICL